MCGAFFSPRPTALRVPADESAQQLHPIGFSAQLTRVCVARISHFSKKAFTSSPAPCNSLIHKAFWVKTLFPFASPLTMEPRCFRRGKMRNFQRSLFHLPPHLQSVRLGGREREGFSAKSFTHNSMMHKKLRNKGEAVKEKKRKTADRRAYARRKRPSLHPKRGGRREKFPLG